MSDSQSPTSQQPSSPAPYAVQHPVAPAGNGLAVAGFILGLLGLLGSWIPILNIFAILLAVVGIVLAGVGLARAKTRNSGRGLAIAGLIMGVLAVIIAILANVVFGKALDDVTSNSVDAPGSSTGASSSGDVGASRANPAPFATKVSGGDWTVKVNSVRTAQSDSLGQRPKNGSTLLVINLTATYNGTDEQGDSSFGTVNYVGSDGKTVDGLEQSTLFVPENQFDSLKTLYKGASQSGNEMLEVPSNYKNGVLAVSPGLLSDDTFISLK